MSEQGSVSLGEILRGWRTKHGLTQKAAANRVGVNQGTWSRWESGQSMPDTEGLATIAKHCEQLSARKLVAAIPTKTIDPTGTEG